jgi:hypothetical protein
MSENLELRRWIQLHRAAYAVAQNSKGRYVAVGTETGAAIYNRSAHLLATYPAKAGGELPVHQLCAPLDFTQVALATRLGSVVLLDVNETEDGFEVTPQHLASQFPDINSLTFSATKERIVLGHHSYTLTALNLEGDVLWQQEDEDTAALGSRWMVTLDPGSDKLYAGSAGSGTNWLVALNAGSGELFHKRACDGTVTAVTVLPGRLGVAVLSPGEYYTARLTVYSPDLNDVLWEKELDGPAVALAADLVEPLLVVGSGYEGLVMLLNAETGDTLATEPLRALVNGVSIANGRSVVAVTQDGSVGLLRYIP